MKITNILLTFALLIVFFVAVAAPFLFTFSIHLSSYIAYWSDFGGYFGGIMSPLVAALALIALMKTLGQQQTQINIMKNQSNKAEILVVIGKLEDDYLSTLKNFEFNFIIGPDAYRETAFNIIDRHTFASWEEVIISAVELEPNQEYKFNDDRLRRAEVFGVAAGNLNQLRIYVEKYDELSGSNVMSKYYAKKYKHHFFRYITKNILKKGFIFES
jgi:hypothetical protein